MSYSRPPVTASFEDLRRRRLPQVLFVHPYLPEGITICDISGFAAMIEEAYRTPSTLHMAVEPDVEGDHRCTGIGNNGMWVWMVTRPTKPRNGQRYTSILQRISHILIAPEADARRLCTVELTPSGRDHLLSSRKPITFTIEALRT